MRTCLNCKHEFVPDVMDYVVEELDNQQGTLKIIIECPKCHTYIASYCVILEDFELINQ